jgi:glycosyltransferase involved in cell wall biosynthesis
MRVAYVCTDRGVPVFGHKGCSVHVREMCRTMRDNGCDVTLFVTRRGGDAPADMRDMPVVDLPGPTSSDAETREIESIAANEAITRALELSGPFDVVYERASLWSVAPMVHARRTDAAGILELNAPLVDEQAQYRTLVHATVAAALLADSLRTARVVAAVSEPVASWARALAGDAIHVNVVPNGVDPRRFGRRNRMDGPRDRFVVGFLGTLKPWHGLETLVDAFRRLTWSVPAARLLIVGDGPQRQIVEAQLMDMGLRDRATFTGAVAHDDVPAHLACMDVAVAPYPPLDDFYFSPLKLTEYMAAGLPVVASAIGQVTSLIEDGATGLLFPAGNSVELARALARLHDDARLRRRLGGNARELVVEHCTWSRTLERIFALAQLPASAPSKELSVSPLDDPEHLVAGGHAS